MFSNISYTLLSISLSKNVFTVDKGEIGFLLYHIIRFKFDLISAYLKIDKSLTLNSSSLSHFVTASLIILSILFSVEYRYFDKTFASLDLVKFISLSNVFLIFSMSNRLSLKITFDFSNFVIVNIYNNII